MIGKPERFWRLDPELVEPLEDTRGQPVQLAAQGVSAQLR